MVFRRINEVIFIDGEQFLLSDLLDVLPNYELIDTPIHFYDGKRHYSSDGKMQVGHDIPCNYVESVFDNISQIRICKAQRENDKKYFESVRGG